MLGGGRKGGEKGGGKGGEQTLVQVAVDALARHSLRVRRFAKRKKRGHVAVPDRRCGHEFIEWVLSGSSIGVMGARDGAGIVDRGYTAPLLGSWWRRSVVIHGRGHGSRLLAN
nr:hypothetical protein CFP56_77120 [Quercus suber]